MRNRMIRSVVLAVGAMLGMIASANAQTVALSKSEANSAKMPYVTPSVLRAVEGVSKREASKNSARVIVTFQAVNIRNSVPSVAAIHTARTSVLAKLPVASYKVISTFSHIPAVSLAINANALAALRANPSIIAINEDRKVFKSMAEANALTGVTSVHDMGVTGEGAVAAIIDTGVDSSGGLVHASLADDLLGQACFRTENDCIGGSTSAEDQDGHGTHVAGIITGPDGVAPDAQFYALKVFTTGNTSDTNILNALDYVVGLNATTPGSINLVNMSLGGDNYADEASCNADGAAYLSALSSLNAQGVSVFVATGNDGEINQVSSPGCLTGAIGVGSVSDAMFTTSFSNCTENGAPDKVTCFSNATPVQGAGELVDMLAPGCRITSTGLNGSTNYTICGTSMSTPYALGVAAVLIDFLNTNAMTMTPAQIEAHMEVTGTPVSDYRMLPTAPTFPRVNPLDMIGALALGAPTGFNVTSTTNSSVTMLWSAVADATEYHVFVSADGGTEMLVGTVNAPSVTFTDNSAACGLLTYHVRSFDGTYESLPSNTDSDTARACPSAPDGLQAAVVDASTIDLTWTDHNANETSNILQRQVDGGGYDDYQTFGAGTHLQHTDAGLSCGSVYDYRAIAQRNADRSIASNVVRYVGCSPSNDEVTGATVISNTPYSNTIDDAQYASTSADDPAHSCRITGSGTGSHTLWWSFTPSSNGKLDLDTMGSADSMSDTLLSVFTGTPGNFTAVACNDDITDSSLASRITELTVTRGTTYSIYVSRWSNEPTTAFGTVVLNAGFAVASNVTVAPTTVSVSEGHATDSYSVKLNVAPSADVTINVTGDADCSVSPIRLKFTALNFNVAKTVTVTAVDDTELEGNHNCVITHSATSADAAYQGISIASVAGNITDNEVATYSLSLSTTGTGMGTVSGAGVYNDGDTAVVTATANVGSTFTGWSGPNGAECSSGSVVMNANKSCTATFTLNTTTTINTGFKKPTANQRDGGGDGNGYENVPGNAYTADGVSAVDTNSGSNTSIACGNAGKDKHRYYNYGFTIPAASNIKGLEVRLNAKADRSVGAPKLCVQISWNGGLTWTAPATTPTLGTTLAEYTLGSSTATWGRRWRASNFTNANFRVRVINVSSSPARDFKLDRIAVRVTYR